MKNIFDEKAKLWDKADFRIKIYRIFADFIKEKIMRKENALDFGCGTGGVSFLLKNELKKIYLLDTSEGMLEVLSEKIADENIENMEIKNFDFYCNSEKFKFDNIYTSMVLHHIENIREFFRAVHSNLNEKGKFFILDLMKEDGSFHADNLKVYHFGFETKELEKLLTEERFHNIIIEEKGNIERNGKKYSLFSLVAEKK